jgi:hypothetical protein
MMIPFREQLIDEAAGGKKKGKEGCNIFRLVRIVSVKECKKCSCHYMLQLLPD